MTLLLNVWLSLISEMRCTALLLLYCSHWCTVLTLQYACFLSTVAPVKPELKKLMRELKTKAANWEDIGVELEVDDGDLKQIKSDNPSDSKSCLRELLRKWLQRVDPQPSWKDIVEAVSEGLGDEELASRIRSKYC